MTEPSPSRASAGKLAGIALCVLAAAALALGIVGLAIPAGTQHVASGATGGSNPSAAPPGGSGRPGGRPGAGSAAGGRTGAVRTRVAPPPSRQAGGGTGQARSPGAAGRAAGHAGEPTAGHAGAPAERHEAPAGPGAPAGTAPGRAPNPHAAPAKLRSVEVRVYNNGTVRHMAHRAAKQMRAAGWHVTEAGNYSGGVIPTTTVYYRPGSRGQAAAERIAKHWSMRAMPRFRGIHDASPGVIVILTDDWHASG